MEMGSITDFYEFDTCTTIDEVKKAELDAVDYDAIVYENALYQVVPTIAITLAGEPIVKYGVFNKETGVMEADAHQIIAARSWCEALAKALKEPEEEIDVDSLPGLTTGGDGSVH